MSDELVVQCPYCGRNNSFDISNQEWKNSIHEIVTSLLSVRLGEHTSSYFVGKEWTEIGSLDGSLSTKIMDIFNRTVGILRFPGKDMRIIWKEPLCNSPKCNAPFEIFISLTPNKTISQIWPHLTGKVNEEGNYTSWPVQRSFEKFLALLNLPLWGEAVVTISILFVFVLLSLMPEFLNTPPDSTLVESAILRFSGALLTGLMIIGLRAMGKELRIDWNLFRDLIEVKNENSFIFWHNYMTARFAGAAVKLSYLEDDKKFKKNSISTHLTQAAFIGGLPSVIILLVTWLILFLPNITYFNYSKLLELVYWGIIAYFSGITAWISMNFSVFMTQNLSLLPMKLTPLNGYSNIKPIRNITLLSLVSFVPVALWPLVLIGATFVLSTQLDVLSIWLVPWLMFTFAFSLFVLSIADRTMIIFGVFYVVILLFLIYLPATSLYNQTLSLVVFGMFWTSLLLYQLVHAFSPLQRILEKNKEDFIYALDIQLVNLSRKIKEHSLDGPFPKENTFGEIERVLNLRETALKAKTSLVDLQVVVSVLSPLFSSIVIPVILDTINKSISQYFKI